MNITSRPFLSRKSSRRTVLPVTTSRSAKSGASVPNSSSIVDSVSAITYSPEFWWTFAAFEHSIIAIIKPALRLPAMMPRRKAAMTEHQENPSPGAPFRAALELEKPLQVAGAINAYTARLAQATGFRALYLSGGGVAANSLGLPDLGISTMDDVLIDIRRIAEAST